tara:strand:+ start:60 stop:572 length:513 start_codon:yes stop_codon:yes gene_type:complete
MSTKDIILKWGLIGGTATIILGLLSYLLAMSDSKIMQYAGVVLMLAVIVLGLFEYRDKLGGGFASFGELFKIGLMIGLIISVVSVIWSYIYMNFIDPELMGRILLKTEIELESRAMSDQDVKIAMEYTKKFMQPTYMAVVSLASTLFMSSIISVISALVIKNNKPEAYFE